ncbi:DUF835 domain-containing protein [Thermococcus atlanticus]
MLGIFRSGGIDLQVIDYRDVEKILNRNTTRHKILITRKHPRLIKPQNVYPIWISKLEHPQAVHPSQLYRIEHLTWEHAQRQPSDIILDALEYLMIEHGVVSTLRFVGKLRDMAVLTNSNFYVSVSDGIDEKTKALIRRIVE